MFDHDRPDADGIDPEGDDDELPAMPSSDGFIWTADCFP